MAADRSQPGMTCGQPLDGRLSLDAEAERRRAAENFSRLQLGRRETRVVRAVREFHCLPARKFLAPLQTVSLDLPDSSALR